MIFATKVIWEQVWYFSVNSMYVKQILTSVILLAGVSLLFFLLSKYNILNAVPPVDSNEELITTVSANPTSLSVPTITPALDGPNIIVFSPKTGDIVDSPFIIKGKAKVFENALTIIIREDNKETELFKESAKTDASNIGQFGDFKVKIPVPISAAGKKLTLEVFSYSVKDRSRENLVAVPIKVVASGTMDIDAYFTNDKLDLENSCIKTFPAKRQILKTQEVAYMSLYQLIQGPNIGELNEGYDTSISGNTKINSVIISSGTAFVDFDEGLGYGVAGSCRVTAIRSQIEATLKQFPTIKNVVISINGRTEDILQP